jgi:hypothetical protein
MLWGGTPCEKSILTRAFCLSDENQIQVHHLRNAGAPEGTPNDTRSMATMNAVRRIAEGGGRRGSSESDHPTTNPDKKDLAKITLL